MGARKARHYGRSQGTRDSKSRHGKRDRRGLDSSGILCKDPTMLVRIGVGALVMLLMLLAVYVVSNFWFVVGPIVVLAFFLFLAWMLGDLILDW